VYLRKLIGSEPFGTLDLRNHLVASALDAEAVHVVSAQKDRKIATRLAQIDALRPELVSVEDHFGLRLIEFQIGVSEDEQSAHERLLDQLIGDISQLLRLCG